MPTLPILSLRILNAQRCNISRFQRLVLLLLLGLDEVLGEHEVGLLLQSLRREVVHVLAAGGEAQVETLEVQHFKEHVLS